MGKVQMIKNHELAACRTSSDIPFLICLWVIGGVYVVLILAMLAADVMFTSPGHLWDALKSREIQYAIQLSLLSCTLTTILSLWVSVPIGYLMSHFQFPGKRWIDAVLDIPIVLPPLVIGLILATAGTNIEETRGIQYGTILVLLLVVLGITLAGVLWRARLRMRSSR